MIIEDIKYKLANMANIALYKELITYPKPGLVSLVDNGSHTDMDADTFLVSIKSLNDYFIKIAEAGSLGLPFSDLKQLGIDAEIEMLNATKQINTHRGSIFILGLLVAASAYSLSKAESFSMISLSMSKLWKNGLLEHKGNINNHGYKVRKEHQLSNVILEASSGFPLICNLSEKYTKLCQIHDESYAKLIIFFAIMQELDDTNLVYRGGIEALKYAKLNSKRIFNYQDNHSKFYDEALNLHHEFIKRNLSPGGCADILAAVIFLNEVKSLWH